MSPLLHAGGVEASPPPDLPSPIHTDTGASGFAEAAHPLASAAGGGGPVASSAGSGSGGSGVYGRILAERGGPRSMTSGSSGGGSGGRVDSGSLWASRKPARPRPPPSSAAGADAGMDADADADADGGEERERELPVEVPGVAAISRSSSSSSSGRSPGRQRPRSRQGLLRPPAPPCRAPPPGIPAGMRRRQISASPSPSLSSQRSLYQMIRRPSATFTEDELEVLRTGSGQSGPPVAFFTDATNSQSPSGRREAEDEAGGQAAEGGGASPPRALKYTKARMTTPLTRIPYVHGAYSAVAPMFIEDAHWMAILRKLMPESHAGVAALVKSSVGGPAGVDPTRLMKWAENNPIIAAFGTLTSDSGETSSKRPARPHKPALEWDVFLDPAIVRRVDMSLQAVEDMDRRDKDIMASDSYDLNARIAADVEVDRQVSRLLNRMMLAHGSTTQLVTEAVGMASKYNFSRVVEQGESRRRKSRWLSSTRTLFSSAATTGDKKIPSLHLSMSNITTSNAYTADEEEGRRSKSIAASGIFVERWLTLYGRALKLGMQIGRSRTRDAPEEKSGTLETSSSSDSSGNPLRSDDEDDEDDDDSGDFPDDSSSVGGSFVIGRDEVADPLSMCGLFLCLGMEDSNARKADHSGSAMSSSANYIRKLLGSPLRVVLDLKSRQVPPRVWGRLLDNMRTRGIAVEGIGSFDIDELRSIGSSCCTPVTQVIFLHSAGDLQRACHAREIRYGDTVFFNAGSLIWKRPTLCEATGLGICADSNNVLDFVEACEEGEGSRPGPWNKQGLAVDGYVFQPYAYPRETLELLSGVVDGCQATLQDYQKHLNLNIGLYVQEFSIGDGTLDALSKFINHYPSIYNLGLAWGGINGATVDGVNGDGYWNQRYIGRDWDLEAEPAKDMKLLAPEDHHLFQRAMHAGDWGQALTVNQIAMDPNKKAGRLHGAMCEVPAYVAAASMLQEYQTNTR